MLNRREFAAALASTAAAAPATRPNILWLTCEDIGPALGCYGDTYADTPNLDRLAARGMMYRNAWSNAPVCAPARTTIISGLYPPSTGSEHMRSMTRLPPEMKMYPSILRAAGYYTSNNSKEDYNVEHTGAVWDQSDARAHWRNRRAGQPFLSVVNYLITHESQIRTRPHNWVHDPAKVRVPAYHPDTPEVRQDWAQYYDNITTMDGMVGKALAELESDGVANDTVVFFYGDHGSGMPRSKRWPYNSGLRVPLIVCVPDKYRHLAPAEYRPGGASDRMAAFVDLAPTVVSLAGVKPPEYLQGSALMGTHPGPERQYNYGFRGRMDERYDLVRSVRDRRYVYIRNYMPHRVYGQFIEYMFETPTTRVWKRLYDEGKLHPPATYFWETKPPEELYDLQNDRDEVQNLAQSREHQDTLRRLRGAEQEWVRSIRDLGFLPEGEIHARAQGSTPYQMGHADARYPAGRVMDAAGLAAGFDAASVPKLTRLLTDPDSGVRYWAAQGLLMRKQPAALADALGDASPYVRIVAAEALARYGGESDIAGAVKVLLELAAADRNGAFVSLFALNSLDQLGTRLRPYAAAIKALVVEDAKAPERVQKYGANIQRRLLSASSG